MRIAYIQTSESRFPKLGEWYVASDGSIRECVKLYSKGEKKSIVLRIELTDEQFFDLAKNARAVACE